MGQNKRVAVTGGSGRAGRMVIAELLSHGYEPANYDRATCERQPCDFVQGSLLERDKMIEAFRGADAIVHIAAIPSGKDGTADEIMQANVVGTFNVFEAALKAGVKKVVFASSIVVYGVGPDWLPAERLPIDESYPLNPIPVYPMSKLLGETIAQGYVLRHGMSAICLRMGNFTQQKTIYGPETPAAALATDIRFAKVLGTDIAKAFRLAIEADISWDVFNICTKYRYAEDGSIDRGPDVLKRAEAAGAKSVDASVLEGSCSFSSEKAERVLGYSPTM